MSISTYKTNTGYRYRAAKMILGRRYTKSFPLKSEAQAWIAIVNAKGVNLSGDLSNYKPQAAKHTQKKDPTLNSAISDYRNNYHTLNKKCDHPLRQLGYFSTYKVNRKSLGEMLLSDVTREHLTIALLDMVEVDGKSFGTHNRYLSAISGLFRWVKKQRKYIPYSFINPARDIERMKEGAGRRLYLSLDEQKALMDASKLSTWPGLSLLLHLYLVTGCRRSEASTLRWDNVNLKTGVVTFLNTKNGKDHSMKLPDPTITILKRWKLSLPATNWVFPMPSNPRVPCRNFDKYWYQARKDAGISHEVRIHDLRHTAASTMLKEGFSLEQIKKTLNHSSITMTQRYAHDADMCETLIKRDLSWTM